MKYKYMHTLDGRPARYDGEQICFVNSYGKFTGKLVSSLGKIRKQQRATLKWRKKKGYDKYDRRIVGKMPIDTRFGYIRVEV